MVLSVHSYIFFAVHVLSPANRSTPTGRGRERRGQQCDIQVRSVRGSEACGKGLVTVIVAVRGLSGDQKRVERAWRQLL